jgi:hypothetical protein
MALFPLGILSAAGAGGADLGSYELITTEILGSAQASIVFSNLGDYSSTYKHLQVRALAKSSDNSVILRNLAVRINGDTGNNYAWHELNGNGSSVVSYAETSNSSMSAGVLVASGGGGTVTTNQHGAFVIDFLDAYSTTKNKTMRALSGAVSSQSSVRLSSGFRNNTASITSLTFFTTGNLAAGTRMSIYGLKG